MTEQECCELFKDDSGHLVYHNEDQIVFNISNIFDVYFNFTHMSEEWKVGNMKTDAPEELVRKIIEEDTYALNLAKTVEIKELVGYTEMKTRIRFFSKRIIKHICSTAIWRMYFNRAYNAVNL